MDDVNSEEWRKRLSYIQRKWLVKEDVVISGMSGRFPKSENVQEFTENLFNGIDMTSSANDRHPAGVHGFPLNCGKVDNLDQFDAEFFGISEKHAHWLDPQLRKLLEVSYETIIDAGIDPKSLNGSNTGFYYGSSFQEIEMAFSEDLYKMPDHLQNHASIVSHTFGLKGPIGQFDTACGSSFSAVNEAFVALKLGLCDRALVAGYNICLIPVVTLEFRDLQMISYSGKSKSLDESADGFGRSEAVCCIMLQLKPEAKRIYSTVVNCRSNADGYKDQGITFPSVKMQRQLMAETYDEVGLDPTTVEYVEAHTTGTQAGDPVELKAIYDIFCHERSPDNPLKIGCLKSNMGHAEAASGLCAMIKANIVFQRGYIPPNIHLQKPNPRIEGLKDGKMIPVTETVPMNGKYISLNCFGFGGSNAHIILKGHQVKCAPESYKIITNIPRLVPICGRTREGIERIQSFLRQKKSSLTCEFLDQLNNYSRTDSRDQKGYTLINQVNEELSFHDHLSDEKWTQSESICIVLPSHQIKFDPLFNHIPIFAKTLDRLTKYTRPLNIELSDFLFGKSRTTSMCEKSVAIVASQLILIDLLRAIKVPVTKFIGTSLGRLIYASTKNPALEERALIVAYLLGYIMDHKSLENGNLDSLNHAKDQILMSDLKVNQYESNKMTGEFHDISDAKFREKFNQVLISLSMEIDPLESLDTTLNNQIDKLKNSMQLNGFKSHSKNEEYSNSDHTDQERFIQAIDRLPSNTILIDFNKSENSSSSLRKVRFIDSSSLDMNRFFHSIGKLYTMHLPIDISCLYSKVNYPVPIDTLSVHSLIDFDHSKKYCVYKYPEYFNHFSGKSSFVSRVALKNAEDWFFSDHKIDGRIIFPATGMLMHVWDVVARFHGIKLITSKVLFGDVSFTRATVLTEKEIGFKINYMPYNNSFIITESDAPVASGKIFMIQNINEAMENYRLNDNETEPKDRPECLNLSRDDIYKELRIRGYDYGPSFQCLAEADQYGRNAKVEWKEVSSLALKSGSILEKFHDADFVFLKSWVPFADCMLQLSLLSNRFYRSSFVPIGFETMLIDPGKIIANVNSIRESNAQKMSYHSKTNGKDVDENVQEDDNRNESSNDNKTVQDTSEDRVLFDVHHDMVTRSLISEGLFVRGLRASYAARRPQKVILETYDFIPFNEKDIMEFKHRKQLESYHRICAKYAELISSKSCPDMVLTARNELKELEKDFSDGKDSCFALLGQLSLILEGSQQKIDFSSLDQDILIGRDLFQSSLSRFLRPFISIFANNYSYCGQMNPSVTIMEYCHAKKTYLDTTKSIIDILSVGRIKVSYTVASSEMDPEMKTMLPGKAPIIAWNAAESPLAGDIARADLLIYRNHSENISSLRSKINHLTQAINSEGFLFIVFRESINKGVEKICSIPELRHIITDLIDSCMNSQDVISMMEDMDWICVSNRLLEPKLLPIRGLLFRKKPDSIHEPKIVHVSPMDYQWIEELKEALKEEDKIVPIWLVGDPRYDQGVIGFTRSLGLGKFGPRVLCISNRFHDNGIDLRNSDLKNSQLKHILDGRLKFNIFDPQLGWGEYNHVEVEEKREEDPRCLTTTSENIQLRVLQPGDLSSIKWCESPVVEQSTDSMINVCYAPLNFKDVMLSSARLPVVFEPSARKINAESMSARIGFEFSGYDHNGNRVMGMTGFGAMTNRYLVKKMDFVWPVPEDWSLEDAATMPVVYGTAIYSLIIRGNLKRGETVLIHAGSGGVGIAAIHLCLSYNCTIYTTVGAAEKRKFILDKFPQLTEANIGNSRDTSFEEMILRGTDGRGVDIVLNSLADDKLQASLRCLAPGGRFIEIGKYDGFKNSPIELGWLDNGRSFHGVMLDSFFNAVPDEMEIVAVKKKRLEDIINKLLKNGAIKPLPRTVFEMDRAEDAFRYMAAGKHIGKVLIKIKDPESLRDISLNSAIKTVDFYPNKIYIVIGGFGGFGLEVALWMAFNGAKHIVINSRSGPQTSYHQYSIDRMVENSVKVVISKHDLTTESGVRQLFNSLTAPVGGIFNSTLAMHDALFMDQTEETFAKVCKCKVNITHNMDKISREMCQSLDYFVVFSSVVSGRGNLGQSNYSLGNSYMESVCERRRRDGLHGLAVQWGFIGDVGFVVEKMGTDIDSIRGTAPQRLHSCLGILERTLNYPNSTISSMVRKEDQNLTPESSGDIIKSISHILGIKDVYSLDPEITLGELGMDSLMAIEVQQALERNFSVSFTTKEIRQLKIRELIVLSKKFSSEKDSQNIQSSPKIDGDVNIDYGEEAATFLEKPFMKLNNHSKDTVFVVPPIEGHYQLFGDLFERMGQSAVGLNWTYDLANFSSIEKIASVFIDRISSQTGNSKVNMIGYSLGGLLALAISKQLEESRSSLKVNKLVLFDADPNILKEAALKFFSSQKLSDLESVQEQEFIKGCLKRYSVDTSKIDELFEFANTRDERFNVAKKLLIVNNFEPSQAEIIMKVNELTLQKGRLISKFEPKIPNDCHVIHFRPRDDLPILQKAVEKDSVIGKQIILDGNHNNLIVKNLDIVTVEILNFLKEESI